MATSNTSAKTASRPVDQKSMAGVTVAIYANAVKGRENKMPMFKVSTKRTYVRNGEYVTVTSLFRDDLPVVQHLHRWAWIRIYELQSEWRKHNDTPEDGSSDDKPSGDKPSDDGSDAKAEETVEE